MAAILFVSMMFAPGAYAQQHRRARHVRNKFVATAYSQFGITRSGEVVRPGTVAADPRVLPLGSIIQVHDPQGYSGQYKVTDTGAKVKGRHIDIFMWDVKEAVRFGRHAVLVQVIRYGRGTPVVAESAPPQETEEGE